MTKVRAGLAAIVASSATAFVDCRSSSTPGGADLPVNSARCQDPAIASAEHRPQPAEPPLPEVWLARHGETEWTQTRQHTGTTDIPLTERGREQARALASSFEGIDFDLVLSSPMQRAEQTARLVGLDPTPDERLVEWKYGEYEGRTTADIQGGRPGWDLWRDGCPGGERAEDVARRLEPLLDELREDTERRVVLFGHAHCFRVLAGSWLELGAMAGRALTLGTASLSVMATEHGRPVIAHWNTVPLERAPTPATTVDATRHR